MRKRKKMYKPIIINNFSMVEIMLCVFIVAIGMMGLSALMPAGLNSQKSSLSTSFSTDAAEQFLRYNASKIKEDWSWSNAFANTKPGSDEPNGYMAKSALEVHGGVNSDNENMMTICHNGTTMTVVSPSSNLNGHFAHGDTLGACEDDGETAFAWLDTSLFEMGNIKIRPDVTLDPAVNANSGFFLLEQSSNGTVEFSAMIRAWKDVTLGEDGGEVAKLNVEVSWPAAVPYDSPERKKEVYSMEMSNAPEIALETASYNSSDCSISKTHGGGFTTSLGSVYDNGDGTYSIEVDVDYDGCTDSDCNQLTDYIVESDPTYTVDLITGDGTTGATSSPATSGSDALDGFRVEFPNGIGGNGTAGSFTVLYSVLTLQGQSFSAKAGGIDQIASFTQNEIEWVFSCTGSAGSNPSGSVTSAAVDDAYEVLPNSGSGSSDYQTLTVSAPGVLANDSTSDGSSLAALLVGNGTTKGTLTLNSDGSFTYVPGPSFTGEDSFTYKAFNGNQLTNVAQVTIEANLEFEIVDGKVIPNMDFDAEIKVLGAAITYGGAYDVMVTSQLNIGTTTVDPFGNFTAAVDANVNDSNNPRTYTVSNIAADTGVSITARSWIKDDSGSSGTSNSDWSEYLTRNSNGALPFVHVLRNGDDVPSVPGYSGQASVVDFLNGYISSDDKVILNDNQVIYLFELGTSDSESSAFDLQDFVAVVTLTASGN